MNNIVPGHEQQKAPDSFFSRLKFGTMLKQCNFNKRSGMSSLELLKLIFSLIFTHKSWSQALSSNDPVATSKKDAACRFLANPNSNWEKLLLLAAVKIITKIRRPQERVVWTHSY
ncbi:MAG: hypothetical protein FWG10_06225 [Eubacteriaceae bacterium]|nr:hypothetical protein [Eubacteriaceae bacterium]